MMGAAWGFGFVIGPALGGQLATVNLRLPFYVASALALANWFYGYLVLPESLPPERRAKTFMWSKANPLGSLRLFLSKPGLLRLASINFLYQLAHNVLPAIFVLYTGYRYGWTPAQVGLMLMATGIGSIFVQIVLVGRVVKKIGERGSLLVGLVGGATGFVIYGLAPTALFYCLDGTYAAWTSRVDDPLRGPVRARAIARRKLKHHGPDGNDRSESLHDDVRVGG